MTSKREEYIRETYSEIVVKETKRERVRGNVYRKESDMYRGRVCVPMRRHSTTGYRKQDCVDRYLYVRRELPKPERRKD